MSKVDYKKMPIITLHQPWCYWIAMGWKTIETRTHDRFKNLKGKRIGIHVGQKWDKYALEEASKYMSERRRLLTDYLKSDGGYIICTAIVSDFRKLNYGDSQAALIECQGNYGLLLSDIHRNNSPAYSIFKGRQGIWYLKDGESWE